MKIRCNGIVGELTSEKSFGSCANCCFVSCLDCIPYDIWPCMDTIFRESESEVFKL